jgi:hypothetical protein
VRVGVIVVVGLAFGVLIVGWLVGRRVVDRRAQEALIVPAPLGTRTPEDVGIPYEAFPITSDGRVLHAWLVRAPDSVTPRRAVLLFHGNRTALSDQVGLQQVLYGRGISSMAFDYSGFGRSSGEPTADHLREDAAAAYRAFVGVVGADAQKFVLGASLGAAVLLDAVHDVQLGTDGVILVGTFASARETAVREGKVPRLLAFLLPNRYDNVRAVRALRRPLLVVHAADDELFPIADAEALVAAAGSTATLVRLDSTAHDQYLTRSEHWEPVVAFIERWGGR